MHGFLVEQFGGAEVMQWRELGQLKPGPRQALVLIRACGVNFAETRMRAGTYSGQELPFVMGMEGAGDRLRRGQRRPSDRKVARLLGGRDRQPGP